MDRSHPSVELQAAPLRAGDIRSNVVRLPRFAFELLGLSEGDPVLIEDRAPVWARALSAHADDEGIRVVRMETTDHAGSAARTGGTVRVSAARVQPASAIEATVEGDKEVTGADLREALEREPVILVGDRLRVDLESDAGGFDMDLGIVGVSLLRVVGRRETFDPTGVRIVSSVPEGPVRLVDETELTWRRKSE